MLKNIPTLFVALVWLGLLWLISLLNLPEGWPRVVAGLLWFGAGVGFWFFIRRLNRK